MAWLSGWSYRKEISITGQSGAGTNFQVEFDIGDSAGGDFHLEGHCTNFPQDIAVTDNDGTTLLDFWIENIALDPLKMWLEVADDLGSNQTIYVYYGKSGATTDSNGTDTFLAFFDGSSSGWTEVDPNSRINFLNDRLEFTGLTRAESAYVYKAITPIEVDWVAEWKLVTAQQDISAHIFSMGISEDIDDLYSHAGDSIGFDYYKTTNNQIYLWEVDGGSATNDFDDLGGTYTTVYMRSTRVGDTAYYYAYSDSERTSLLGSTSLDVTNVTAGNMDYYYLLSTLHATGTAAMSGYIDDHISRKYLATEPAFSSAGSEETPPTGVTIPVLMHHYNQMMRA